MKAKTDAVDRLSIDKDYELAYWATKLGVTTARLAAVVAEVGHRLTDVRRALEK